MKPIVGKFYKAECGAKIKIIADGYGPNGDKFIGVVTDKATGFGDFIVLYSEIGRPLLHNFDNYTIVEVWREPIKLRAWVNVYPHGRMSLHISKENAEVNARDRIACIEVSGEEKLE